MLRGSTDAETSAHGVLLGRPAPDTQSIPTIAERVVVGVDDVEAQSGL